MKRSIRVFATVCLVGVMDASAASRVAILAEGNCDDNAFRSSARLFAQAAARRFGDQVTETQKASERIRPSTNRSVDEIQRQLTAAQTQFYNQQYQQARQQTDEALLEIERLPPGPEHWSAFVGAKVLQGTIMLSAKQGARAAEAFGAVLAVDPGHQLDVDRYSPSVRTAFDKARQALASGKQEALQVRSNVPGSEVFVNGFGVGKAPLDLQLVPGSYQVQLRYEGMTSFSHSVVLTQAASLHVDMGFEGAIEPGVPLCIKEQSSRDRLEVPVKLGALLGADEMAVVRLHRPSTGGVWVVGSLISVAGGRWLREGGLRSDAGGSDRQIEDLVSYVVSGRTAPGLVVAGQNQAAFPWSPDPGSQLRPRTGAEDRVALSSPPVATAHKSRSFFSNSRSRAWIPAIDAGVLLGTGTAFYVMAKGKEGALRDGSADVQDPAKTVSRGRSYERLGFGLGTAGLLAAGFAATMYFLNTGPGGAAPAAGLAPIRGGAMVSLQGAFP